MQLDDKLVERLDAVASRVGVSRSELLRQGAAAVIEAYGMAEADRRLVEAYQRLPQDPVMVATAARLAAETIPAW